MIQLMKGIKRICKFEEIQGMVSVAPEFFPDSQAMLDACYVFLVDGFCYIGFRSCKYHPNIAEVMMHSDKKTQGVLQSSLFETVLNLAKKCGFKRMAIYPTNKRLKNIYLKKGWLTPWGNGWFLNKES